MINLSQKNVVKIAKETNFIKDNVEKVMRLADILEFVFTSKWKDKLALKGGTAINMFYPNLPRLSVDIDLTYIETIIDIARSVYDIVIIVYKKQNYDQFL